MRQFALSLLLVLPGAPVIYAADCVTSFDDTCLSREYKTEEIEAEQERRAKELEEFQHAAEELEAREAEEEASQQAQALEEERRHPRPPTDGEVRDAMKKDDITDLLNLYPQPEPTTNVRIVP